MSVEKRHAVSALALVAGILGATGVQAQDKPGAVEEIVVTAQKRSERLQEVPISIGVLEGDDLEKSGARGIADQLNQVGGVNLIENRPGEAQISVRGASAGGPFDTGAAPVGYYLDEVPFSFITSAILPDANAYDLQRVEVLKGPQGTLYGASSLNGVVRILTRDADLDGFEVKGRGRYGWSEHSKNIYNGDLAVNVPIIPGKLAVRGVGSYANYGGYISSPKDAAEDFNDSTIQSYRFKINAAPTDRLDIKFGAWVSRIDNKGPAVANADYVTPFSADQPYSYDYEAYNLVLNYDFGPISLLSSTGYIDLRSGGKLDFLQAIGPFVLPITLVDDRTSKTFSQELRFTSSFSGPWQTTGGVLYRDVDEVIDKAIPDFFPGTSARTASGSKSYAMFGEVTRSFWNDKVKLTGGIRYFHDTEKSDEQSSLLFGTFGPLGKLKSNFEAITWRVVASYYPSKDLTLYASAGTGFRTGLNQDFTAMLSGLPAKVDADELRTYEIGAKGSLFNGRLSYELAGYHQTWDNPQQASFTPPPLLGLAIVNADSASGFGVSAGLNARITEHLSVNASGDWNNLEFDQDQTTLGVVLYPKGGRMNTSPEITWAVGGEYRHPVGTGDLEAFISGSARYNSKMIRYDLLNTALGVIAVTTESDNIFYGMLQAGVETDRWSAAFFVDNVTNENGGISTSAALIPAQPRLRPRTIGVQASFKY